jgi:uroporphyrinogen III methyltransferase/synthase
MPSKPGKVYLVGAGPGDPGLLTLRGKEVLSKGDVVIYDRLANPRLLDFAPQGSEFVYVGKRMGCHAVTQDEINRLIVEHALRGKMVVRLKGGDPFIFGRGGEEAAFCREHNIPFELVPGVSSAIAAPAYAGIPLTHRSHTASVTIVTGHRMFDANETDVDWEGLANGVGTLVFLMGMKNLPHIVSRLVEGGRPSDSPVAAIQWGTTPMQKTVTGTLGDIEKKVKKAGLKPPSVIVIGDVVSLKDRLEWFEKKPLFGKKIVITRARHQAGSLVKLLEKKGAICIEFPCIDISMPFDLSPLDSALLRLASYDWVIFGSVNAVRFFFKRLDDLDLDARALSQTKIAVAGSGTSHCLSGFFLKADMIPKRFQAEGLIDKFRELDMAGKKILIPGASIARKVLPKELSLMGAQVDKVTVYETKMAGPPPEVLKYLEEHFVDMVTFTSSSTVKNFLKILPPSLKSKLLSQTKMACIGPVTSETLEASGASTDIMPERATIEDLVKAIEEYFIVH